MAKYYAPAQGALRVAMMDMHPGGLDGYVREMRTEKYLSWQDIATEVERECGAAVTASLLQRMYGDTDWGAKRPEWWKSEAVIARKALRDRKVPALKQAESGADL